MTDPTTPAPAAPAAPAASDNDSPQALRAAAIAVATRDETPAAEPAKPEPAAEAPAPEGDDWATIAAAARAKREEREAQARAKQSESDREKALREREEKLAAIERQLEEDPLSYLDAKGKTKPVYERLSEQIIADGKAPPTPEQIQRMIDDRVEARLREIEDRRTQTQSQHQQERAYRDAVANFEKFVGDNRDATPALASVAPHVREMYARQVASALEVQGKPYDFALVAKYAEQALRADLPGWAPASAGDRDQAKGQSKAGGVAEPTTITGSLAGQSSTGDDDDDSPAALRRRAIRLAEQLEAKAQ